MIGPRRERVGDRHGINYSQQAKTVLSAAEEKALELGVPMNIAIVDAGNNLTAFVRQTARGSARSRLPKTRHSRRGRLTLQPPSSPS
jgi:hypothetical protein